MIGKQMTTGRGHADVRRCFGAGICQPWVDGEEWYETEPTAIADELWDVFLLDDEAAEPEPQEGDFWIEPNDEDLI